MPTPSYILDKFLEIQWIYYPFNLKGFLDTCRVSHLFSSSPTEYTVPLSLKSTLLTLSLVLLAGCATGPLPKDTVSSGNYPKSERKIPVSNEDSGPISLKPHDKETPPANFRAEIERGTGTFINEDAAKNPLAPPAAEGQITFNFDNQPIQAVVQAILGELLKENYTIAPGVAGNVTFSTSKPIKPDQALSVLEMLLSWTKNALVYKDGRYLITTIGEAIPGNLTPRIAEPKLAKGYEIRVFPLHFISPVEMTKLLKPYARPEAVVSADTSRSMMILAGNASELENYQRVIDMFDVDWLKGMSVGVYTLQYVEVEKILPELEKVFGPSSETPMAGMFRFLPLARLNAVVVITPNQDYLEQAEKWLHRLDVGGGAEAGTQLYVYDVKNVKAEDLAGKLNEIFTGAKAAPKKTGGNVAPGLTPVEVVGTSNKSKKAQPQPAATPTPQPASSLGSQETEIRITHIEENNQLLVLSTASEWEIIQSAVKRLDIPPLQVQIQTRILEVTLSGDLSYGVQWYLTGTIGTAENSAQRSGQYTPPFTGNPYDRHKLSLGATGNVGRDKPNGFFYSFLNKNFEVAINALETSGNTKLLSAPSLIVLNNKEATIDVGTNIPITQTYIPSNQNITTPAITGNTTNTNSVGATPYANVQYLSTGTKLTVTPRVNPGGLVFLEIGQEVSVAGDAKGSVNPPVDKRSLDTSIAVQSGETVLLGGLIRTDDIISKSGLPVLSRIPVLGRLFGTTTNNTKRTELLVLITPTVIFNSQDAREITEEYQQQFQSLKPLRQTKQAPEPTPPESPLHPTGESTPAPKQ